jgi:hypothetical protein
MEVREVVRRIRWQTWTEVWVGAGVKGQVTLNIKNAPLPVALDLIAEQISARNTRLYALYHQRSALKQLRERIIQGADDPVAGRYWTNLPARGGFGPGGGGGPGRGFGFGPGGGDGETASEGIQVKFEAKDAASAARTLSAACRAQVVPADSVDMKVTVDIRAATPEEAVNEFAKALFCQVNSYHVLQAGGGGPGGPGGRRGPPEGMDEETLRARMEARMAERLDAMTPEQRARMEAMRDLSPEERRARMEARMEDPAVQESMANRSLNSIRNSTPEQIVQRKRERMQRMQSMQPPGQDAQRPPQGFPPQP